jgi:hypothetical protein
MLLLQRRFQRIQSTISRYKEIVRWEHLQEVNLTSVDVQAKSQDPRVPQDHQSCWKTSSCQSWRTCLHLAIIENNAPFKELPVWFNEWSDLAKLMSS